MRRIYCLMRVQRPNFLRLPRALKWRIVLLSLALFVGLWGYGSYWKWTRRPVWTSFTTQKRGEESRVWRVMRDVWKFSPDSVAGQWPVTELFGDDTRLYYASYGQVGCLDADTGKPLWRFPEAGAVTSAGVALWNGRGGSGRTWSLVRDGEQLVACEMSNNPEPSGNPFSIVGLDPATGKKLWEQRFFTDPAGPVIPAGPYLLLPNGDGTVKALRHRDGALVWQKSYTARPYVTPDQELTVQMDTTDRIGVIQIGTDHLVGFRVADGGLLWSVPAFPKAGAPKTLALRKMRKEMETAENGSGTAFVLKNGTVTLLRDNNVATTLDISTGKRLWKQELEGFSGQARFVSGAGDQVTLYANDTLSAHSLGKQRTAWFATYTGLQSILNETSLPAETGTPSASPPVSNWQPSFRLPFQREMGPAKERKYASTPPSASPRTLYLVINDDPVVNRVVRVVRSVPGISTLMAIDAATGKRLWSWQPPGTMQFDRIVVGRHRLYLSNGNEIVAVEDGTPPPLPQSPHGRYVLAQRMLSMDYQWPVMKEDPVERLTQWMMPVTYGRARPQNVNASNYSNTLTLLALGRSSVKPLLEFIHHTISELDRQPVPTPPLSPQERFYASYADFAKLEATLDLLFDIDDASVVPVLIDELQRARRPDCRDILAQALLFWGDRRALRPLFQFAQADGPSKGTREDALYFVSRHSVPTGKTAAEMGYPPDAPTEQEVTDLLLKWLATPGRTNHLAPFARFQLIGRGAKERRAALATFYPEPSGRLMPPEDVSIRVGNRSMANRQGRNRNPGFARFDVPAHFSDRIDPLATAEDETGRSWAVFFSSYFEREATHQHIWFAQTRDLWPVRCWHKPVFGLDIAKLCTHDGSVVRRSMRLTCRDGLLTLRWLEYTEDETGTMKQWKHQNALRIEDLYRDSDGDGIPDRVEKLVGLDPHRKDSNGNGIPDNIDKNPLYRPHRLTEQEQIFQATLEALCQLGRAMPGLKPTEEEDGGSPLPFGRTDRPLFLVAPPGSPGVDLHGQPGMVFWHSLPKGSFSSLSSMASEAMDDSQHPPTVFPGGGYFCSPFIGLDGNCRGWGALSNAQNRRQIDPLAAPAKPRTVPRRDSKPGKTDEEKPKAVKTSAPPDRFQDFFPMIRSADGKRVRVGFQALPAGYLRFDIELHKIDGRWLPVECRRVSVEGFGWNNTAILPISNREDENQMRISWRGNMF